MISAVKKGGTCRTAVVVVLGAAAVFWIVVACAAPIFANTDDHGDHDVNVTAADEIILGGSVSENVTLRPTMTSNDAKAAGALSIKSTVNWKLQWQAVTGNLGAESLTPAGGTNLGTSGFTSSGGYAYAGSQTTASTGDQWGVVLAAIGGSLAATPTLTPSLSTIATGNPTLVASVTPTYSVSTSGALGTMSYYGTIYYVLSSNVAP